jgi:hypothetical protein
LALACLGLHAAAMPAAHAQERAEQERLIKAAFVYNIAKFTRWPETPASNAPLTLCLAGEDTLIDALGQLRGKLVKGQPLAVQKLVGNQAPRHCNLLYVAASKQAGQLDLIKSAYGQPTLTISELPEFASAGGMVELYREDGRVRFIINLGSVRSAGLEVSPRLLNLAVVVGLD